MRSPFVLLFGLCASLVAAQNSTSPNAINEPNGGLSLSPGQSSTITWSNPTGQTVTIKLQQSGSSITSSTGTTLASSIPNSGSASINLPNNLKAGQQYTIEIINDQDPNNPNFSSNFVPGGSSNSASSSGASSTGSASSTASASSASASSASTSSASASSASASSSASSSGSSSAAASSTSSSSPSSTSSASASSQSTSAPSQGAASSLKVQAGFVAIMLGAIAAF